MNKSNIFNIPANYHFFESLFNWLEENFSKELPKVKIFLPNRRSCRELRHVFLNKNFNGVLPQIKAILDISYEDFFDFNAQDEIDKALKINVLEGINYLFFLANEIVKNPSVFGEVNFEQSFKIAIKLKDLFDEIEREEIDLKKLEEIDDSNLSKHRQLTLEFLKDFHIHIKNSLLKKNIFLGSSYQNFIIKKFIELLEKQGSKTPLVIAGSTGSIPSSKKLIKTISQQKNGFVVLHGFSNEKFSEENHPQFFLNQLVAYLDKKVENFSDEKFKLSDKNRQDLVSLMMLPAQETVRWQRISSYLDITKTKEDLTKNFCLIEAKNEIEEAKIISLILRENIKNKSALITNNQNLTELVKLELKRLGIKFNDARNLDIFDSKLISFLLLILDFLKSEFNSHSLLALVKHPLCQFSQDQQKLAEFEINILRQDRPTSKPQNNAFLKEVLQKIDFKSLVKSAENLSNKSWHELLLDEPAQVEIFEFFEKLEAQNYMPNSLEDFKTLLAQISYFEKSDSMSSIQILSTIEARLLNFDCVIIASLNEEDFPQIEGENWLGKKIRKDLGIDKSSKKIGQSSYDFCNYLSNESVFLTRCRSRNGVALIESPFLLKFKTICKKIEIKLNLGEKYFSLLKKINNPQLLEIKRAEPKPKKELRPKEFSITEISKLLSDPYFIYAKKILQLRELKKIDYEPGYAEFGSFVHKALEEFIKNPKNQNFEEIFEKYFLSNEAKIIWLPKFENIFSDFLLKNEEFSDFKNLVEKSVNTRIGNVLLKGKIDRIIFDKKENGEIFDYKTGQVPQKNEVILGTEPQLTIAALMLVEEKFKIAAINYWKLSSLNEGKITKMSKDSKEIEIMISAAKSGLERLFAFFENEENGYLASGNFDKSEYKNLART